MQFIAEASFARQFLGYLDHIGLDERMLGVGDVDPALRRSTAPMAVSARLQVDLIEAAATVLQRPDLGVHFADWLNPHGFGALQLLGQHSTSLAERVRLAQRYVHLQTNALAFEADDDGETVTVRCVVHPALRGRATQYAEAMVALCVRNSRGLLGAGWNPPRIEFAHPRPASIATQQRYFRCPIDYDGACDSFSVPRADYYRRLSAGDPETMVFLEGLLRSQEVHWPADLQGQVENLISAQLSQGGASLRRIAALMAMSPRTLQRRLAAEGHEFSDLLAGVRARIVREQLGRRQRPSLAVLSHLLGYSEPSAVSRFIRAHFDATSRAVGDT